MPETDATQLAEATLAGLGPRVDVPTYDRRALRPGIVHIGVGGFHRSHLATYVDELCRAGHRDWAIAGSGVLASDVAMAEALAAQDNLYALIVRGADTESVSIIGALVDYIHAHPQTGALVDRIAGPDTEIVSLTVTEGGYPVDDVTGAYDPGSPVAGPKSAFGILAEALERRRSQGGRPITVVSCDNIMSNGDAARASTLGEAARVDDGLVDWIGANVAFPNSMVDRITPVTADSDRDWLAREHGVLDRWPVVAEPFRQWVIEDRFAGEAPPLADVGVLLTDDVEPYERLKLRLLNAGHSGLAYLSALLDIELVDQAMADAAIERFVVAFLDEAGDALPPIDGIDVDDYKRSLVVRFANPAIGDQIARLCLDGSAKFPKFLLPTIRASVAAGREPRLGALALAGWCQYLVGTSESGRAIDRSADPLLGAAIGHAEASLADPTAFLRFAEVFDDDLAGAPAFVAAFERCLLGLRASGVRSTIEMMLEHHDNP